MLLCFFPSFASTPEAMVNANNTQITQTWDSKDNFLGQVILALCHMYSFYDDFENILTGYNSLITNTLSTVLVLC